MHAVSIYKNGIAALLRSDAGLAKLSGKAILRGIPNLREAADASARRTLTEDECQALLHACEEDARWSLLVRILREIGLRVSSICHMKYWMLLDQTHTPRHVCRVPEKGKTWRSFVTSFRLKQAAKRFSQRNCARAGKCRLAATSTCFIRLTPQNRWINKPCLDSSAP